MLTEPQPVAETQVTTRRDPLVTVLMVWVALLPVQFQITEVGQADRFAPADLVILLVPFVALHRLVLRRGTWSLSHSLMMLLLPASLIYTLAIRGSVTSYALVNKTAGMFLLFLAYIALTVAFRSYEQVARVVRVFVASVTIVNVFSVVFLLLVWDQPIFNDLGNDMDRLTGMLVDPNAYGGLLVATLAFLIPGVRSGRRLLPNWLHYAAWISLPIGILLTQSRSAWLALGVLFIALAVTSPGIAARALFAMLVVIVVVAIAAGADTRASFIDRSDRPQNIDSRVQHIRDAMDSYVSSPVFGIGLGVFYEEFGQIVHVTALWFMSDMGIIGLMVFIGFAGTFSLWAWRLARKRREGPEGDLTLGLLLAHISVLGLSVGIEVMYQRHWWLFFALIATLYAREGFGAGSDVAELAGPAATESRFYRSNA